MNHNSPEFLNFLKEIPDFYHFKKATNWISEGLRILQRTVQVQEIASWDWEEIKENKSELFGWQMSLVWRKFVLVAFLADLVSYSKKNDRVSFDRLQYVMHQFPQGFRIWFAKIESRWWPVGYSGWYPMLASVYALFKNTPSELKDRTVIPRAIQDNETFLYLFNFSVASQFKKTELSKKLVKGLVKDVYNVNPKGIACITVSDEGVKIAKQFGMIQQGMICFDGSEEFVFTT